MRGRNPNVGSDSRKDLVETRVQVLRQLRADLELALPGTIGLFTKPGPILHGRRAW